MRIFVFSLFISTLLWGCGGASIRPSEPSTPEVVYYNPPGTAPRTNAEESLYEEFFRRTIDALQSAKTNRKEGTTALLHAADQLISQLEGLPTVGGWQDSPETRILVKVVLYRRDLGESARRLNCIYKDQVRWPRVEGNAGDFPAFRPLVCR